MKVIMYSSDICPDCVDAKKQLAALPKLELDYRSITESTTRLKEFLSFRDHEEMFVSIKEHGKIGIPFFILADGTKTFDVGDFVQIDRPTSSASSCSLDGEKQC
ncbi:MAG TPA: glutaredoxin [Oscillospiraceae bacterium]|nr:glutaredoxin [Oscillospiraceae bacterium]